MIWKFCYHCLGHRYCAPLPLETTDFSKWLRYNKEVTSVLHTTKIDTVTFAHPALCTRCHMKLRQGVDFCGMLWEQARTRFTVVSGTAGETGLVALKMHNFCSSVWHCASMDVRLGGSLWNVCKMHIAEMLLILSLPNSEQTIPFCFEIATFRINQI